MSRPPRPWRDFAVGVTKYALKAFFWALVVMLPLFGAWIGSSLAAFGNRATWVPIAAAVLAFPVLPLVWDAFDSWFRSYRARKRKQKPKG